MFIDDTGDVNPIASNHPQQRYASITGVIFEMDYLHSTFEPGFRVLRKKHFGLLRHGKPPILHLRKIKKAEGHFAALINAERREAWQRDCLSMYKRAKYHVVTVSVDKIAFYYHHQNWDGDVYGLLVGNAIERFFYFLRGRGTGDVMAEAINGDCDKRLRELYTGFYETGTEHISSDRLQSVLSTREIKIKPKNKDIDGLQFADLLASTSFNHCRRIYANGPDYDPFAMSVAEVLEQEKFYRDPSGNPNRYGRVWRPTS